MEAIVRHVQASTLCALIVAASPGSTGAQTRSPFYAGGSAGLFSVSADEVSRRRPAAGIVAGTAVKPWLDLEGELVVPAGDFTRSYTGIGISFAPPGSTYDEIQRRGVRIRYDKRRHVMVGASAVVLVHPSGPRRVMAAFVAGVTNHFVRDRSHNTPIAVPPGIDPNDPSVRAQEERSTRNLGGLTVGANIAIAVTPHIVVQPDLRFDYGSIGDEINNALRTSLRLLWRF
jgi:hypothetical protein